MLKSNLKDRDHIIQAQVKELSNLLSGKDTERILEAIDELDLFAFTPFTIGHRPTNFLLESLRLGLEDVATSVFSEGLDNLRAALIPGDCYEMAGDSPIADLSFLEHELSKKAYFLVIDIVDLRAFQALFERSKPACMEFIMGDAKFKSLFEASPQSQQESFVRAMSSQHGSILAKKPYGKVFRKLRNVVSEPILLTDIEVHTVVDPLLNE